MSTKEIKLVVNHNNKLYKVNVDENILKKNESGQFILPANTISAGFSNRVWGIDWDELPFIETNKFNEILQKY